MMPFIIIVKVRKFHQATVNCSSTAGQKSVGGGTLSEFIIQKGCYKVLVTLFQMNVNLVTNC